ncbi:MAG: hypothetical protein HKN25_17535 [Pyrinomonadaceae bacterium]|nr:hypothetical protein [Pyrinomonadaceae bacterium]
MCLTYLFAEKESFLWRLCAGNIVGSAVFGLICFVISNFFGLSVLTIIISLAISSASILLLRNDKIKKRLKFEWQRGKDRNQGASFKRFWRLTYYIFFLVVFIAFFDRAMIVTADGIFTGASQNLGDLPYHLGGIFGFADGNNFPPQNPSFAGAKFTYPFIADFLTACLVKLGSSVDSAMLIQNVSWAFSLLVILEGFALKITGSKLAGKIAPVILFFSGGLGFLWFLGDYWYGTQGLFEILWNLPRDYTIGDNFRWGNSLVTLFITQRSLLLGMPLTIIVMGYLWKLAALGHLIDADSGLKDKDPDANEGFPYSALIIGLVAGTLPFIHAHSLAVLFLISAWLLFMSIWSWRKWLVFAIGVSVIAIPELIWILSGSATNMSQFIGWHWGWDARGQNLFWFWIKNTGIFIPLLVAAALYLSAIRTNNDSAEKALSTSSENENSIEQQKPFRLSTSVFVLLEYLTPFLIIFALANFVKFAPWEWDNIKILIYWFVGVIPLAALLLAWMWQRDKYFRVASICLLICLTSSGALDVWRTASAQMKNRVFDKDAVEIAKKLKDSTEPGALFLNAPTYNSAVVLTGRRSLMRYIGHLSSHGIYYEEREKDLQRIYAGEATAEIFLKKYDIEYVLISPKEREYATKNSFKLNEQFFEKFPVEAESGEYKVFKIKK